MHPTYMTTEAMTTEHVKVFRIIVCVNQVTVKFRVQISSDELYRYLKYLSLNHKPYNFWPPQDVLLPVSGHGFSSQVVTCFFTF